MKKYTILILLILVGLITLGSVPATDYVHAEDIEAIELESDILDAGKSSDRGYLIISPTHLRYDGILEPGNTYTKSFRAINIGSKPITFNLTIEPFSVEDETYKPIYSQPTNHTKITDWITLPEGKRFTLEPQGGDNLDECDGCYVDLPIRVRIPIDAVGGGQYAAVMANIEPTEDEEGSSIVQAVARIALPIYSTVNGDLVYKGNIINQRITNFTFEPIIKTTSTVENLGNADFLASYHLSIEPFFGGETAYDETQEKIIMPETKRIFSQNWEDAPLLGIFNVTQEITYLDEDGKEVTDTFKRLSIICPLWLILIVIAILILFVISIIFDKKRRKAGNKKPSWEQ